LLAGCHRLWALVLARAQLEETQSNVKKPCSGRNPKVGIPQQGQQSHEVVP
jgi:hypothetical protein